MKSVNNNIALSVKKFCLVSFITSLSLIGGCSSSTVKITQDFKNTPEVSQTNMSGAIGCMAAELKHGQTNNAYVFLVRDITDGTVKEGPYQDSPLSDAGRIQLMNVLSEHLYPQVGVVTDNFPLMFTQLGKEDVGLNRFGLPAPENLDVFMSAYNDIIQNARQSKGLAPANNIVPLIVSGSFTRFDTDNITQDGMGQNLGTRTKRLADNELDNIWRKTTGETDIGKTSSARAISLVMNLTDPRNNLVVSSQSFDLIFYRDNKTFRLRIGVGDGYYGISKDHVEVEGVHAAQKTLVDAAAFWLLNKAYGGQTDFGRCFSDSQRKLTLTTEQLAEISAQNRAAQQALADKHARLKRNTNNEDNKESKSVRPRG